MLNKITRVLACCLFIAAIAKQAVAESIAFSFIHVPSKESSEAMFLRVVARNPFHKVATPMLALSKSYNDSSSGGGPFSPTGEYTITIHCSIQDRKGIWLPGEAFTQKIHLKAMDSVTIKASCHLDSRKILIPYQVGIKVNTE